ncbi:STAS domain-containing protein [Candidatus Peregrinibacteria bacterium]|nr:STAS domain-containing protein [Candidatus Peregrinibacteria bacterium]
MSDIQIAFQDLTLGAKAAKLITFVGQLDETNVDHEARKIYQVITEMAEPVLLLDFSDLEYMNSKSIGYVTDWFTQASAKNGSISIIGPKPNILDILKVVGITQIITVYNTLEEAKTALGGAFIAEVAPAPVTPAAPAASPPAAPTETPVSVAPAAPTETPAPPAV